MQQRPGLTAGGDRPPASLQSLLPSIGLTKRKLRYLEAIQLVREQRESRQQQLAPGRSSCAVSRYDDRPKTDSLTPAATESSSSTSRDIPNSASLSVRIV